MNKKKLANNPLDDFESGPSILDKASALIAEQVSAAVNCIAESVDHPTDGGIQHIENQIDDIEKIVDAVREKSNTTTTSAVPSNYSNPFYGECPEFEMGKIQQAILKRQWEQCQEAWGQGYDHYLQQSHSFDSLQLLFAITLHVVENLSIINFVGVQPIEDEHSLIFSLQKHLRAASVDADAPILSVEIVKHHIMSEDHRYSSFYTQELMQDLCCSHPSTATVYQIASSIAEDISAEIYNDIKHRLKGSPSTECIKYIDDESLVLQLYRATQTMAQRNRRGAGNRLIASNAIVAALIRSELLFINDDASKRYGHMGYIGDVGPRGSKSGVQVFCDADLPIGEMLLIYKGISETDCGAFFCPLTIVSQSGLITDPSTFQPQIRLMGKYGQANAINEHGEDILNEYVTHITVSNMSYSVEDDKMLTELFEKKPIKSALQNVAGFYSPMMPLGREVR